MTEQWIVVGGLAEGCPVPGIAAPAGSLSKTCVYATAFVYKSEAVLPWDHRFCAAKRVAAAEGYGGVG